MQVCLDETALHDNQVFDTACFEHASFALLSQLLSVEAEVLVIVVADMDFLYVCQLAPAYA